jgi:hypothetical protein
MATVTDTYDKCDILGKKGSTEKPVQKVRCRLEVRQPDGSWNNGYSTNPADMCPAALDRAKGFVRSAFCPPPKRPRKPKAEQGAGDA